MKDKKLKSKIDFQPPTINAYDGEKIPTRYLMDEIGQWANPDQHINLKDLFAKAKNSKLKFQKSNKK